MNSVYLCTTDPIQPEGYYLPEPPDERLMELIVASTRGKARALAQSTVKLECVEFTDWRLRKIGETDEPEGILPDNSIWWAESFDDE